MARSSEAEQKLVPFGFELLDGARSDLGVDAVDELLLQFRVSAPAIRGPSTKAVIGPANCWKKCSIPPAPPPR